VSVYAAPTALELEKEGEAFVQRDLDDFLQENNPLKYYPQLAAQVERAVEETEFYQKRIETVAKNLKDVIEGGVDSRAVEQVGNIVHNAYQKWDLQPYNTVYYANKWIYNRIKSLNKEQQAELEPIGEALDEAKKNLDDTRASFKLGLNQVYELLNFIEMTEEEIENHEEDPEENQESLVKNRELLETFKNKIKGKINDINHVVSITVFVKKMKEAAAALDVLLPKPEE